jgi:uncharacterized protein YbaR (Trm112 family)
MRLVTIQKLCCPFDKSDLQLSVISTDIDKNILEGILSCQTCMRVYPIVKGVPIMSPDEYREFKIEQPLLDRWTEGKVANNFRLIQNDAKKAI